MALKFQWLFSFWCPYYHPFKNWNPPKIGGQQAYGAFRHMHVKSDGLLCSNLLMNLHCDLVSQLQVPPAPLG